MVVARWNGRAARKTDLAIVGKGLTFDGGGLNLKLQLIEKMKFDMGGAAAAIAALRLLAAQKAKLNVAVVLAVCENVIAGDAYRPGDVIGSLEGLTIEVANTDAEGRIVVADGISYAKRFKPELLVDIATLTGSISMILHQEFAGLYTNDDALAEKIAAAAEQTGDRVWRMPLSPLQDYIVDSDIADVRNLGASNGLGLPSGTSSVAGAKFLERFAGGQRWAHLDMASTVLSSRQRGALRPGPTGWGVRLLAALAADLD
jgi:leucyl aminopeptidase